MIPATAGKLTLAYPQWIPGEHAPGGPLSQVVRLTFSAGGKTLAWRRDDLDMYEFRVDVPAGVKRVEADLDFACVIGGEGFRSYVCSSQDQLVVNWWEVVLYSPAVANDQNRVKAKIRLPAGWKYGVSPLTSLQSTRFRGSAQDPGAESFLVAALLFLAEAFPIANIPGVIPAT